MTIDLHIVIPSRRRAHRIAAETLRMVPDATVCIEDSEAADYAGITDKLWLHPPLGSLSAIRRWIISNSPHQVVVQLDDDLTCVISQVGQSPRRYREPAIIRQVIENAAEIALELGIGAFGFNLIPDPRFFNPFDPICFNKFVGGVFGVIGKDILHDEALSLHDDVDYTLQHLLHKRIVFRDDRFLFTSDLTVRKQEGGNTAWRSSERDAFEMRYLKDKWGRFFHAYRGKNTKGSIICIPKVPRRQGAKS